MLFRRWFVDDSLERHNWNIDNFDGNFLIFIDSVVFTSESLMFHCFFIDDSLMTPWKNIDDPRKIWMQTLKIIEVSNVIIIRTLMVLCCLIDGSLMILWRIFDKILMISVQTLKTIHFVCANVGNRDVSSLLPWLFVDDALEEHCWNLEKFDGNFFDLYCFCCVNLWISVVSLLHHRWFFDVSLKNRWSYSEDFVASINDL